MSSSTRWRSLRRLLGTLLLASLSGQRCRRWGGGLSRDGHRRLRSFAGWLAGLSSAHGRLGVALDRLLDHQIGGAADQQKMFDIVTADQDQLSP